MLKFYDYAPAPGPRRARIFIAEKNIEVETIHVALDEGEEFTEEFMALNQQCTVPVLVLEDGTAITENAGISVYLEAIQPEPSLLGKDAKEKSLVAMWNARCEFELYQAITESFRNKVKGFSSRAITGPVKFEQIPELVSRGRSRAELFFKILDEHLANNEFIAGDNYSVADITTQVAIGFADWIKLNIPEDQTNLTRWLEQVNARPSASA